jgi:hypothetical protein
MATGALFRVKILRRDAEHVVTLNANTMENRLPWCGGFVFRGMGLGLSGFVGHTRILAQWRATQHARSSFRASGYGIPVKGRRILTAAVGAFKAAVARLPHGTLLECPILKLPVESGRARAE